ncbi:YdcH family protein [Bauldia sp.]|uniref:YdcH family protein n=1 Tax=Bauldia sp. TaxID=2575872 RepID=UPI003BA99D96
MSAEEEEQIRQQLAALRQEHRDLDAAIEAMIESGPQDTVRIQRMKKRKLALRDRIAGLEDQLLPDIIA